MTRYSERASLDVKESASPVIEDTGKEEIAQNEFYIDPVKEKLLLVKLDIFLTPVIMLVYLCCFLDRSNIGMSFYSNKLRYHGVLVLIL
jgi:hypothetical protein